MLKLAEPPRRPTRALLSAINAAVREFSPEGLFELRRRLVVAGESAVVVALLESELQKRQCCCGAER